MGLHPLATKLAPATTKTFLGLDARERYKFDLERSPWAVPYFAWWWDEQHDAEAALEAVWQHDPEGVWPKAEITIFPDCDPPCISSHMGINSTGEVPEMAIGGPKPNM